MDTFDVRKYITENRIKEQEGYERRYEITFADGSTEQIGKHISVSPEDVIGSLKKKYARQGKEIKNIEHIGIKPLDLYEEKDVIEPDEDGNVDDEESEDVPFEDKDVNEVIDAFGDVAQKKLKAKSAESLQQMLGGKSFQQASMDSMSILQDVMKAEEPYRDQLEELAKDIVIKMFPVIEQAGIEIDAKLVSSPQQMKISSEDKVDTEEEAEEALDAVAEKSGVDKRRIINSITQGAGIRGTKAYYMFDYALDVLDTLGVKDAYEELVNNSYGIYDDDAAIAMMMAMLAQGGGAQGGESEIDWNEEEDTMTIKATALTFPILMQEIVKGLYEFVSLQGFTDTTKGQGQAIVKATDKTTNEPEDIRYGKFIYDALRDLVVDSDADNELFFSEVYKLPDAEFKIFIENAINDQLTSQQKSWVEDTIQDLESDE